MDVILLKNIKNLGNIGTTVSVKSGYARNFLIPTKQAVLPTRENLARVEEQKQELLKLEEEMKSQALADKDRFNDYKITFEVNIQEEDKLYGSITLQSIMDRLKEDGFDLLKKQVNLPSGPIKTFKDDYIITISLHSDISVTIPIELIKNTQNTKDIVPDLTNEMDDAKDTEQVSDAQHD